MKFLATDAETGGVKSTKHSLLTAYFAVCDVSFNTLDELALQMKPDVGDFVVEDEALKINGIDLEEHKTNAVSYDFASGLLKEFLDKNTNNKKEKLVLLGQNVGFDSDFYQQYIIPSKNWKQYVLHKFSKEVRFDPMNIILLLKVKGIVPSEVGFSLQAMAEFFGVKYNNAHDAKADIKITIRLLQKMMKALDTGKVL